ncbi:MAG: hypothetical protein RL128_1985, partial [Pseudomonadota bacterium]
QEAAPASDMDPAELDAQDEAGIAELLAYEADLMFVVVDG